MAEYSVGYIATRNPVKGKPEALLVHQYPDGTLESPFAPSVDQAATVHATREAARAEAVQRWH